MENRIVVTICDQEYTLVAEESASYMQKVGSYVSEKMEEIRRRCADGGEPGGRAF